MSELILPISTVADESLGSEAVGGVYGNEHMIFSDGTSVDWITVELPPRGEVPGVRVDGYGVYEPDGKPVVDPLRAARRARIAFSGALMDEALRQDRLELWPPAFLDQD